MKSTSLINCKAGCGACCIAPSIHSPIPGMPNGKPAGVPCVNLTQDFKCQLFGKPERPTFCGSLQPSLEMCGQANQSREYAIEWLSALELATQPDR